MASSNTHFEPAKMEQIITEFFAKSVHTILESRCPSVSSRNYSTPSPSSSSSSSSRDKWCNLALRDCPAAFENIDYLEPVIVDVYLVQSYGCSLYEGKENAKIIERWILQYESKKSSSVNVKCKRSASTSFHTLYKKSILMLRSLYSTLRLLPAYKLFRDLISSAQIRMYTLGHRISSFIEPFTRGEEANMHRFMFTPVETSCGLLSLSVLYTSSLSDFVGSEASTLVVPHFIPEYVGSPLAEPLKRFPSGSTPFVRRHSWSYDLYGVSKQCSDPLAPPSQSPLLQSSPSHHDSSKALLRFGSAPLSISPPPKPYSIPPPLPNRCVPPHQPPSSIDKCSSSGREEHGRKAATSSNSHAEISSGPLDDEDYGLSGVFIVDDDDDDDLMNPDSRCRRSVARRQHSRELSFGKKQDDAAAFAALIQMLKKAPPLRGDPQQHSHEVSESSKTTMTASDALRELGGYTQMKELLLKQQQQQQHGKSS